MKSFTDIEQSKKLAEILPLKTADMHYNNVSIKGINYVDEHRAELMDYNTAQKVLSKYLVNPMFEIIPCWSLAALIGLLPKVINRDYVINITQNSTNTWFITYDLFADRDCSFNGLISKSNSFVDACVEMIIKLKELNLL